MVHEWKKIPPHNKPHIGCLNCGAPEMIRVDNTTIKADLDTVLYQGFGGWHITKDDELIYMADPNTSWSKFYKLRRYERMARKDPDHDWRAVCNLPLRDAEYQRQGDGLWVLISSGPGFA